MVNYKFSTTDNDKYSTYSLKDVNVTFEHPSLGSFSLSDYGGGRISWQLGGDITSHTTAANGYVVVNRVWLHNGTISVEVPQNSTADKNLMMWAEYVKNNCPATECALAEMQVTDNASGKSWSFHNISPQKTPDTTYDQTSGMVQYGMLFVDYEAESGL